MLKLSHQNRSILIKEVSDMTKDLFAGLYQGNYKKDLHTLYTTNLEFLQKFKDEELITESELKILKEDAYRIFIEYGEEF